MSRILRSFIYRLFAEASIACAAVLACADLASLLGGDLPSPSHSPFASLLQAAGMPVPYPAVWLLRLLTLILFLSAAVQFWRAADRAHQEDTILSGVYHLRHIIGARKRFRRGLLLTLAGTGSQLLAGLPLLRWLPRPARQHAWLGWAELLLPALALLTIARAHPRLLPWQSRYRRQWAWLLITLALFALLAGGDLFLRSLS